MVIPFFNGAGVGLRVSHELSCIFEEWVTGRVGRCSIPLHTHNAETNRSCTFSLLFSLSLSLPPSFSHSHFLPVFIYLSIVVCVYVCVSLCVYVISSLTLYLFFASEYLLQDFFLPIRTNFHLSSRWLDDKSFTCALYKPLGLEKPSKWRISWLIKGSGRSSMKEKWEDVEKDERVFWLM